MPARPLALGLRGPNRVAIGRVRRMVAALRRLGGNLWMPEQRVFGDGEPNLLTAPEDLSSATWSKSSVTPQVNVATAPDGTLTADKLVANVSAADVYHVGYVTWAVSVGLIHTFSIHVKAAEYTSVRLSDIANGRFAVTVNLTTNAISATAGAGYVSTAVSDANGGWKRIAVTINSSLAGSAGLGLIGLPASGFTETQWGSQYAGDGTSGVYVWGAKFEPGYATPYTPQSVLATRGAYTDVAGTTPVTAYADLLGLTTDRLGVLGPNRVTNGDFSSGATGWTLDAGISVSAGKLAFNTPDATAYALNAGTVEANKTYEAVFQMSDFVSGGVSFANNGASVGSVFSLNGPCRQIFTATQTGILAVRARLGPTVAAVDDITVRELTGSHATQSAVASKPSVQRVPKRLGPNLVVDGSFDDVSKWTAGTGWAVTGGNAVATSAASGVNVLPNAGGYNPTESGKSYKSEVVITAVSAGGVQLIIWNGSTNVANTQTITAPGTYSLTYTANNTQCRPYLSAQGASTSLSAASLSNSEVLEWANVISFDGNNDFLQTGITTGNEGFVAVGFRPAATGAQAMISSGANSNVTAGAMLRLETANSPQILCGNGTTREFVADYSFVAAVGVPVVIEGGWTASSMYVAANGGAGASLAKTVNCTTANTFSLGIAPGATNPANGVMHAAAYAPILPDAATRKIIINGLAALQGRGPL